MNTKLTIENLASGTLLCTLEVPMGKAEVIRLTLEHPKDLKRTTSQLELQLLQAARDRLSEMCSQHPESKRT